MAIARALLHWICEDDEVRQRGRGECLERLTASIKALYEIIGTVHSLRYNKLKALWASRLHRHQKQTRSSGTPHISFQCFSLVCSMVGMHYISFCKKVIVLQALIENTAKFSKHWKFFFFFCIIYLCLQDWDKWFTLLMRSPGKWQTNRLVLQLQGQPRVLKALLQNPLHQK